MEQPKVAIQNPAGINASMIYTLLSGLNNSSAMQTILDLHAPGTQVLDVTYGLGRFWEGNTKYKVTASDINDNLPNLNFVADCRHLPVGDNSFDVIVFDPPYMHRASKAKAHLAGKRGFRVGAYSYIPKQEYLAQLMSDCNTEFYRVLRPQGILVVKIMDIIERVPPSWNHIVAVNAFSKFFLDDLFIFPTRGIARAWNWGRQYHAKKNHAYFMIFRKQKRQL